MERWRLQRCTVSGKGRDEDYRDVQLVVRGRDVDNRVVQLVVRGKNGD